jgi:hypothetical protein
LTVLVISSVMVPSPFPAGWVVWGVSGARAQEDVAAPGPERAEQDATARALFTEAVGMVDAEQWDEAEDLFRRSLELRASPVVAYNLASVLVERGRLVEASEVLRRLPRMRPVPPPVERAAASLLERVEARVGRVTIEVDGLTPAHRVRIDRRDLNAAALGVPVPADPGTSSVVATIEGEIVANSWVTIPEGGDATVRLEIPPVRTPSDRARPLDAATDGEPRAPDSDESEAEGGSIFGSPWLWISLLVVAAGGTALAVWLASGTADPVPGTLQPSVVEF